MGGNEKPTLDRRNRTAQRERANILLAGALMLAVLIVVGAAVLTLAPTGSDGTSGHSPSSSDVETLEAGLEPIFIESYDLFTDEVPPPQASQERPPIDPETATELLESQPFTDRQLTETVEWLLALANQDTSAGDIATLEATNETQTGTLIRLGNDGSHDFAGEGQTLYENAATIQDLVIVLETATLPHEPQEPFELRIGDWKMEAYQENGTSDTIYRVDGFVGGGPLATSDEQLRLDFSDNAINGVSVPGNQSLAVDPGREEFDITVIDTPATDESNGTHGGLNIVASGGEATIPPAHTREVVTHAAFKATYLDDATTYTSHLTVPAQYTALDVEPCDCERSEYTELVLDVETEDADALAGIDGENIWFPAYHAQSSEYELTVTERALNGTVLGDRTADADVTAHSSDCDECVTFNHSTASGAALESPERTVATPHNLTEQLRINATVENRTVTTNVTVHDPYREADLSVADTLTVGQTVTDGAFTLTPYNTTQTDYEVGLDEMASVEFVATEQVVTELAAEIGVESGDEALIGDAITQLAGVDDIVDFFSLPPDEQAAELGYDGDEQDTVADFFDAIDAEEVAISDDVLDHPDRTDAVAALFADTTEFDGDALIELGRAIETLSKRGPGIQPHYLYAIGDENGITDQDAFNLVTEMVGLEDNSEYGNMDPREALFRFIDWYATDPADLYTLEDDEILNANWDVAEYLDYHDDEKNADGSLFETEYFLENMSAFPAPGHPAATYPDTTFTDLNETEKQEFLWLSGVTDADDRNSFRAIADELEDELTVGWGELFDLAQFNLLDMDILLNDGVMALDGILGLNTDWDVTASATYDGYGFTDYTATNETTVTDPSADIERIDAEILPEGGVKKLVENENFEYSVSLPHDPIVVGHPAQVHTVVTFTDGTTEVNPEYVQYELVGPSDGVDPNDFAILDTSNTTTVTATNRTGPINGGKTGPIAVKADVSDGVVTDTARAEAVDLEIEGGVTFDAAGQYKPEVFVEWRDISFPRNLSAMPGIKYTLLWGTDRTEGPVFEPVGAGDHGTVDIGEGEYNDQRQVIRVEGETDGEQNITVAEIDEESALGLSLDGERYHDGVGIYEVDEYSGGGGGGGGGGGSLVLQARGGYNYFAPDLSDTPQEPVEWRSMTATVTEGEEISVDVRNSFQAVAASSSDLRNGHVSWRSSDCNTEGTPPCTESPYAVADFYAPMSASVSASPSGDVRVAGTSGGRWGGVWVEGIRPGSGSVSVTASSSDIEGSAGFSVEVESLD